MDTSRFLLHRPAILDYWQVDRVPVDVKQFIVLNPDKKMTVNFARLLVLKNETLNNCRSTS